MKLRFLARDDLLVFVPNHGRTAAGGTRPRYVGRTYDANWSGTPKCLPATDAFEVDPTDRSAARLIRQVKEGALWPADAETARACGVAFVPVVVSGGVVSQSERKGSK